MSVTISEETYTCYPYKKYEENILKNFDNNINPNLVSYLKDFVTEQKYKDNETKLYFIKNSKNEIIMFFSLRCGQLFKDNTIKEENIELFNKLKLTMIDLNSNNEDIQQKANSKLSKIELEIGQKDNLNVFYELCELAELEISDEQISKKEGTILVQQTFSAIEIVVLCKNTSVVTEKNIGVNIFWQFIAKIVLDISKQVGCQYLYLFASDSDEDKKLIQYYSNKLLFREIQNNPNCLKTLKSYWSNSCYTLYQEISDLKDMYVTKFEKENIDSKKQMLKENKRLKEENQRLKEEIKRLKLSNKNVSNSITE